MLHNQPSYMGHYPQPSTKLEWSLSALPQPTYTPSQNLSVEFQSLDQPLSRQPSCWEPPVTQAPQGYLSYDQSPTRQLSCEDPAAHRAPQACLPYVQPPPHTAGSHHLVDVNIAPSTAANPPPNSPSLVREDEEVVQKNSGKALWSNQSKTILEDEAYGHGMANDDKLASWRLKINDSSPTKSSRDGHSNDGESLNSNSSSFSNYGYITKQDPMASQALEDEEASVVQEQVKQIKAQEEEFENLELEILHRKSRTRFEADRNFLVALNSIIAVRYHITEYCGSAAFSTAIAIHAHDLHTDMAVCVKIIMNNQDFFDQSRDDIKMLDTDVRLIPPRIDTLCLGIFGHVVRFRGCGTLGAYSSLRLQRITRRRRVKEQEFDHEENLGLLHLDLHILEQEVCEWRRSKSTLSSRWELRSNEER